MLTPVLGLVVGESLNEKNRLPVDHPHDCYSSENLIGFVVEFDNVPLVESGDLG